jgi:5-methylthioribose kinase
LIALEDLGKQMIIRFVWFRTKITEEELVQLVNYLNGLHQSFQKTVVDGELPHRNENIELWTFFEYPLEKKTDLDTVQEGLQDCFAVQKRLGIKKKKKNWALLSKGDVLHRKLVKTADGSKVMDLSFVFMACANLI